MPYSGGRLSTFLMSSLVVSSVAFRPEALRAGRKVDATRLQQASKRCLSSGFRCRTSRTSRHHQQTPKRVLSPPSTSVLSIKSTALPLWANTQLGTVRISARSALRLLTSSIPPKRVRVVTDIDDTVKSSGNKRLLGIPLGGIDAQYNRGVFYPGVFQFSLELARYRVPSWQDPLSVAVLTARAREFLFALEIGHTHKISRAFRHCAEINGLKSWGRGPVLYGSVKEWICPSRKSQRKARNFTKLVEDDSLGGHGSPSGAEGGYIFVGDTGEGDPRAGELMCHTYPKHMRAVFLHVVSSAQKQGRVAIPADRVVNGVPIVYFRTYVGAAVKAVQLGLMDETGLENIITAGKEALETTSLKSSKWKDMEKDMVMAENVESRPESMSIESLTLALDNAFAPKARLQDALEIEPALAVASAIRTGRGVRPTALVP